MKMKKLLCIIPLILILASCSSSPKRPMEVTDKQTLAAANYEAANNALACGNYEEARNLLNSAYETALSVDNRELLCRISLSAVIYRISEPASENAKKALFTDLPASELISFAKEMAKSSSEESFLSSLTDVYEAKVTSLDSSKKDFSVEITILNRAENQVSSNQFYLAFLYKTRGQLYMRSSNFSKAESDLRKAAEIHLSQRYLYELGSDWYEIARCLSLAGRKTEAVNAMQNAIKYDKDAENSYGIASDYDGLAQILRKQPSTDADKAKAKNAASWAAKIYTISGETEKAAKCLAE